MTEYIAEDTHDISLYFNNKTFHCTKVPSLRMAVMLLAKHLNTSLKETLSVYHHLAEDAYEKLESEMKVLDYLEGRCVVDLTTDLYKENNGN